MKKYCKSADWLCQNLIPNETALLIPTVSKKADLSLVIELNATAINIWDIIKKPMTLDEVCAELQKDLDTNIKQLKLDVQSCLAELVEAKAVELL